MKWVIFLFVFILTQSTLALNSDVIDRKFNDGIANYENEMIAKRTETIDLINSKIASVSDELNSLSQLARLRTKEISKNKTFVKFRSYCSVLQAYISFNSMRLKDEFDPLEISNNLTKSSNKTYDEFLLIIREKNEELKPIMDDPKRRKMCVISKFVRFSSSVFNDLNAKYAKLFSEDQARLIKTIDNITNSLRTIKNLINNNVDTCLELVDPTNCVSSFIQNHGKQIYNKINVADQITQMVVDQYNVLESRKDGSMELLETKYNEIKNVLLKC